MHLEIRNMSRALICSISVIIAIIAWSIYHLRAFEIISELFLISTIICLLVIAGSGFCVYSYGMPSWLTIPAMSSLWIGSLILVIIAIMAWPIYSFEIIGGFIVVNVIGISVFILYRNPSLRQLPAIGTLFYIAWAVFTFCYVSRGYKLPTNPATYNSTFSPVSIVEVMNEVNRANHFSLLEGTKGTGKSAFGIELATRNIERGQVALFIHVVGDATPEQALAKHLGVDSVTSSLFLYLWKTFWGKKPLVIFDIHSKDDFRPATFRAEVKRLVADTDLMRALIIASDGLLFQQLTHEPRLTTFIAQELTILLAEEFLMQMNSSIVKVSKPILRLTPRTLENLIELAQVEPDNVKQTVEAGILQVVDSITGAFQNCAHRKELLQMALNETKLMWGKVDALCGNKYDTQDKFNQQVVKKRNLFFPTGTDSYKPQFDQTVEAMKRVLKMW